MDQLQNSIDELEQAIERNCRLIQELRGIIAQAQENVNACIEAANYGVNKDALLYLLTQTEICLRPERN